MHQRRTEPVSSTICPTANSAGRGPRVRPDRMCGRPEGPSGFFFPASFGVAHDGVGCCDELGAILGCAGAELE